MTPQEWLERAGRMLYGSQWVDGFAVQLGVGDKSVRDWHSGKNARFGWDHPVVAEIKALLVEQHTEMMAAGVRP